MTNRVPDLIICLIIVVSFGVVHIGSNFLHLIFGADTPDVPITQLVDQHAKEYGWILKLVVNVFGYACVFVPGIIIYKYTRAVKYIEKSTRGFIPEAVKLCFNGADVDRMDSGEKPSQRTAFKECVILTYCFFGLMCSYLTWGVLQEKIMTQEYINEEKKRSHFKDSQFLVFTNRILAFTITLIYLIMRRQTRHKAPLFKYSFASFSNIMSAWFQYEALKFVNFPTQVLAKSCKIIPVMLMGKIISRTKYEFYEYVTAVCISVGMMFFLTGSVDESKASSVTTITGILLLILYLVFDSFTSNWQGDLFKTYQMSSIQMMCGVNLFSSLFTCVSIAIQGGFMMSLQFATEHPKFAVDCVILSISSAVGQLFIFYTIANFGPVVFTIIMSVRQAIAILLSCIIYNHNISALGMFGICIVFFSIFLRIYCNQRLKALRRHADTLRPRLTA